MMRSSFTGYYTHYLMLSLLAVIATVAFMSSTFVLTQPNHVHTVGPRLSIQFTCANAVDDKKGTVCVHTQVKAALIIRVKYCSGYNAVSKSLKGIQYADTHGNHTWVWTPHTRCKGPAIAYVYEQYGGGYLSAVDTFTVR